MVAGAYKMLGGFGMSQDEQSSVGSGFHEGVTIPVRAVGAAGASLHTDATIVMPRTGVSAGLGSGLLLQTAVQQRQTGDAVGGLRAHHQGDYDMVKAITKGGWGRSIRRGMGV